jgi:hypothetical protein
MRMSYEEKWKVLADLLVEVQEKGKKNPAEILNDLRSAKTMIQILKANPTNIESLSRIETYLRNVESHIIFTAEKLGTETVQTCLKKLKETKEEKKENKNELSNFVHGVPRNKKWVRIQLSEETPLNEIQKLVKQNKLLYKALEKEHIIIYGDKNNIKSFVKSVAERFRSYRNEEKGV